MFGVLFLGAASIIFQTSENERAISSKAVVPVKTTDSEFDLSSY
tara:strand:+ start:166 stop:297 length:132 start_codon:yes stop_codon:yes gene_type:complete